MQENYPIPNERYQHYKGGLYEIVYMAIHSETQEKMVVYKSINFGSVYVRPYVEWCKPLDDGRLRFEKQKDNTSWDY
jgi:hypothetical protein